ncbi:hypothetical protein NQ315_000798 [Exocentrus adspersus]|uniref:Uncharacterized protein n=1 Tax=Exocentrus adspersus TaxID=1586481 RepID=A0AAV8WDG3_9CUCU|nr:hypothetical protein NQ315_000798 [Exocentrus adspersus]
MKATLFCTLSCLLVLAMLSTSQAASVPDCGDVNAAFNSCGSLCPVTCQQKRASTLSGNLFC